MKHDVKSGWCCCGEYHGPKTSRPRRAVDPVVDPKEMARILGRKECSVRPVIRHRGKTL